MEREVGGKSEIYFYTAVCLFLVLVNGRFWTIKI
jgi:hypothetical protein